MNADGSRGRNGANARHRGEEAALLAGAAGEETRLTGRVWRTGRGALVTDAEGRDHIDLGGGTLTQALGHCHPDVVAAVRAQAGELENVHDCPTPTRLRAAKALARLLPPQLDRVAFLTTGAEAVEAALRIVHAAAGPARRRIAALRRGYHGKTRGARSLVQWEVGTEPPAAVSLGYPAYCYRCPFGLAYPGCDLLCARLTARQVLERDDVAAFIAEPVQGAAGVIVPPPGYWEILTGACRRSGVLLVADEVLTGGGRTGAFLACDIYGIEPDLVTLAKGIGSGYPVAALAGRHGVLSEANCAAAGGLASTFAGSPVGLAAASATLEAISRDDLPARARELASVMSDALHPLAAEPTVGDIRQIGLLCGIEIVADRTTRRPAPERAAHIIQRAADLDVRVIPGGHVIRIAPPLIIDEATLRDALGRLGQAIRDTARGAIR
jgi:4-aminobutyrate aminotransferase/(S)-3-amino-2-methylpropionate transaminase